MTGNNSDSESIPYKERDEKWIIDNENIFKEGPWKSVTDNSCNNGDKKLNIQTSETGIICYTTK